MNGKRPIYPLHEECRILYLVDSSHLSIRKNIGENALSLKILTKTGERILTHTVGWGVLHNSGNATVCS